MRVKIYFSFLLFFYFGGQSAQAQKQTLEGRILDQVTNEDLQKVKITNISRRSEAISGTNGTFKILAALNDLLVFEASGYKTDTVMVVSFNPLKHYLLADMNNLQTVRINRIASYKEQYAQELRRARSVSLVQGRGLIFSPSRIFGREGKQARYFKRMIEKEQFELAIDRKFNAKTITAILPLKQPDLDVFMMRYRPSLGFVRRADADDFKFYLIDAYNKFKKLPEDKKRLIQLKSDSLKKNERLIH